MIDGVAFRTLLSRPEVGYDSFYRGCVTPVEDNRIIRFGAFELDVGAGELRRRGTRAIALDPSLSEAHTSLAFIKLTYDWDWATAETEFRRGIALNPHAANGHHWYAHYLMAARRTAEAEKESRQALQLDPLSLIMNVHLAWHFTYARQFGEIFGCLESALSFWDRQPRPVIFKSVQKPGRYVE